MDSKNLPKIWHEVYHKFYLMMKKTNVDYYGFIYFFFFMLPFEVQILSEIIKIIAFQNMIN